MPDGAPVSYMEALTRHYERLEYEPYRWFHADEPPPWTPLGAPLAKSRLGVLVTAGAYLPGQTGFYYKDDASVRAIPVDTANERIHFAHLTENYLVDARRDPGSSQHRSMIGPRGPAHEEILDPLRIVGLADILEVEPSE